MAVAGLGERCGAEGMIFRALSGYPNVSLDCSPTRRRRRRGSTTGFWLNEPGMSVVTALINIAIIGVLAYLALDRLIPQEPPEDGQPPDC